MPVESDYVAMEACPKPGCTLKWHLPPHAHLTYGQPAWEVPFVRQSVSLRDLPTDRPAPLLLDRLAPDGPTILFGMGGVGKGVLAASWIARLAEDGMRVLIIDYEGNAGEWGRRVGALARTDAALDMVEYLAPRNPLAASVELVASHVRELGIDYMVVDSAVMACGADPMKPEAAMAYGDALVRIACPTLTLAHITKSREDGSVYPFGSVFWHNTARVTWSLSKDGGGLVLANRKHNNYEQAARVSVEVTWRDDVPGEVWERSYRETLADRIEALMGDESMSVGQLVEALATEDGSPSRFSVIAALKRDKLRFRCTQDGRSQVWSCVQ